VGISHRNDVTTALQEAFHEFPVISGQVLELVDEDVGRKCAQFAWSIVRRMPPRTSSPVQKLAHCTPGRRDSNSANGGD